MAMERTRCVWWCDSDPNVANQAHMLKDAGYRFQYFPYTQALIAAYKANGTELDICAIITSSMSSRPHGGLTGIEMINHLKSFVSSMKCSNPVFAICSLSIKQDACTKLISSNRDDIQRKVIEAVKHNVNQPQVSCNAKGCNENHSSHYCKLCNQEDSDHRAMECPQGTVLYHGTKAMHFQSIINLCDGSLFASKGGRLGPGVYFTTNLEHATIIARDYNPGSNADGYMVLTCLVNLGKTKQTGLNEGDGAGKWREEKENYDSCFGPHPEWLSFKNGELHEYVLKDANKFRIKEVTLYGAQIDFDIFAPRLTINLKDKSSINLANKITLGKINPATGKALL